MKEFHKHPVFFALQPDLNVVVADWVALLTDRYIYEAPEDLYEDLRVMILQRENKTGLEESDRGRLREWLDVTPVKDVVAAVVERGGWGKNARPPRKATPEQLQIIDEAQKEVGLDFTRFFNEFTSWEADCVIKGIITISETQRQTGDRHFKPKELRQAVRDYIRNRA